MDGGTGGPGRVAGRRHPIVRISCLRVLHRHNVVIHTIGLGILPPGGRTTHSLLRPSPDLSPCSALLYT